TNGIVSLTTNGPLVVAATVLMVLALGRLIPVAPAWSARLVTVMVPAAPSLIPPVVTSDSVVQPVPACVIGALTALLPLVAASGGGTPVGRPGGRIGDWTKTRSACVRLSEPAVLAASSVIARLPVNGASVTARPAPVVTLPVSVMLLATNKTLLAPAVIPVF